MAICETPILEKLILFNQCQKVSEKTFCKSLIECIQQYETNREEKKEFLRNMDAFNYGASQLMMEQPVVRSTLLLLGSIGLFVVEYLMLFGY